MRILGLNSINNLAFTSRREDVRKAQDVERRAKLAFPMLSDTYIEENFKCIEDVEEASNKYSHLQDKIASMRAQLSSGETIKYVYTDEGKTIPYASELNIYKKEAVGNCQENSIAGLAALAANGYYNSERAKLYAQYDIVNTETGEIEETMTTPLDHAFAITDMNKGGEKDIVVDPWLGFADTKQGAIAKFKQVYDEIDWTRSKKVLMRLFKYDKIQNEESFDPAKYACRSKMVIIPTEELLESKRLVDLGEYAREHYENIMLPEED